MVMRPRGWHLWEHHVLVDGQAVPGGLFDFALYFFHNARRLLDNGHGPFFYLPKMQVRVPAARVALPDTACLLAAALPACCVSRGGVGWSGGT